MASRPEVVAPPEIFYDDAEARNYTSSSRIIQIQWLCNADKSSHNPQLRLKAFFTSLYRCLTNGARAVFQVYPANIDQHELILNAAEHAGFTGGIVVDFPHRCDQRSINASLSKSKDEDDESCSNDHNKDEENKTVCISDRHRPWKKQKNSKSGKGREWIKKKEEQMRRRGNVVPPDTKYIGQNRRIAFDIVWKLPYIYYMLMAIANCILLGS